MSLLDTIRNFFRAPIQRRRTSYKVPSQESRVGAQETTYRQGDIHELRQTMMRRIEQLNGRTHYDAGNTGRLRDDWYTKYDVPYGDIKNDLARLIARSRREVSNNGIASGIVNTIVTNVIGTGIWPKPMIKDGSGKLVKTLNESIERVWEKFVEQFDRSGWGNFYQCQALALETEITSGTVLVNKTNAVDGSYLGISFQMIEPDRLDAAMDNQKITLDMNDPQAQVLHGIGLDKYGVPVRYYIKGVANPVPASNMFHVYNRKRPEQYIGIPWLHASLPDLWDYRQLKEDNLVKSRIIADIALWSHTDNVFPGAGRKNSDDNYDWEPGMIIRTKQKPEIIQAQDNLAEVLQPLLKLVLLDACSGAGISYMSVSRDMDGVNFAASRTNLTEDRRLYRRIQEHFIRAFCQPIYAHVVAQAVLEGKIKGVTADTFSRDRWYYTQSHWQAEGWDWVDPGSDAKASVSMYESGLSTLGSEYGKRGIDWRDAIDQRTEEIVYAQEKAKTLGVEYKDLIGGVKDVAPPIAEGGDDAGQSTGDKKDGKPE